MTDQVDLEEDVNVEAETTSAKPDARVGGWLKELEKAEKREKEWRRVAHKAVELYEAGKPEESPYNILFSNTETLSPALYNTVPRPVVKTRYRTQNEVGKAAALVGGRLLEFMLDPGRNDEITFDSLVKDNLLNALVPGRGHVRFTYDAVLEKAPPPEEGQEELPDVVKDEYICGVAVNWDGFLHGWARRWKDVPWVAYQHVMSRGELVDNFGDIGKKVPVTEAKDAGQQEGKSTVEMAAVDDAEGAKVATVWEIWDKRTKKVLFLATSYKGGFLKEVDDPLGLQGFFSGPEPLRLFDKISSLTPTALYSLYQKQAEELNVITKRITVIVKALKVRGFYDAQIADLAKLLESEDNTMLPAENLKALFGQGQTASDAIWILPLTDLISALQQLYTQRTAIKAIIFELTGIADIMRGSSQASETLGAQEIKNQWGTLRLKRMQKRVANYCRDMLRIMLELAVTKLSQDTIRRMTDLPYPSQQEKQQAQQQLQVIQEQAMMQPAGPEGQPAEQPQIDPKLQGLAQMPTWEEILAVLKDDLQRNFYIDVETNSTIDAEATEDKKDLNEMMAALSQFLLAIGPMVKDGTLPFEAAKSLLSGITRRFRLGDEVDIALKTMQPPKPQGQDDGKAQEFALRLKELEAQSKRDQEKHALEMEKLRAQLDFLREELKLNMEAKRQESQFKGQEMMRKEAVANAAHQRNMQQASMMQTGPMSMGKMGKKGAV